MRLFAIGMLLTLVVAAAPKDERAVRSVSVDAEMTVLSETVAGEGDVVTDFECLDLGSFADQCWTRDGIEVCAEAVGSLLEIVEPGHWTMGDRALAWAEKCLSDETSVIRLRFGTPVQTMQLTLGVSTEPRSLVCWVGVDVDAPLELPASFGLEPSPDHPIDLPWSIGMHVGCSGDGCGIIACDVHGDSVDNIRVGVGQSTGNRR